MNRRSWLLGLTASLASAIVAGCDKVTRAPRTLRTLKVAEKWTQGAQRAIIGRHALAREFSESDISKVFKANGVTNPGDADYKALQAGGFTDWRLEVGGLVERPLSLSLEQVRALPSRTQITRHDCVEGWSSIGKWKGARLSAVLDAAGLKPEAKYIVFHCMDTIEPGARNSTQGKYYESIDLVDARHEQTILAYEMNGGALPVPHGAPLRLRVERQLGYKQAKYIRRIEAVASLKGIGGGEGGYWEDQGYEWYAGI
jgi:DMSO/TMAO reductase YedYZ molybdopterin-dependent catalytic subunit